MKDQEKVVTALKIEKNRFFVLGMGKEKWVYASEDEAMKSLTGKLMLDDDVRSEDVWVTKVRILKRKWKVEELPWSEAFVDLVRLGGLQKKE